MKSFDAKSFEQSLKVKRLPELHEAGKEAEIKKCKEQEYKKYDDIYGNKDIQNYFHNAIGVIMLTHHKRYEDFTVEIPYRFKAPKSIKDKIDDYASRTTLIYDFKTKKSHMNMKKINDVFAMKIIACNRPPTFYSSDPEIEELVEEKKKNHKFLGEMQNFKSKLIENEFANPKTYKYECTKVEYFENCKKLLQQIETLISPSATNLFDSYDRQIADIDNRLAFLKAANDEDQLIDEDDITNDKMNFFKVLDDFTSRVHDKLDLAVLTKQFTSLFENNELFTTLGISLSQEPMKEKRTKDGFVSNFIYIDTYFGTIECQLQSQHEYQEGNYGYAAHTNLKGKAIQPFTIPSIKDKPKINEFIQNIKEIAPKSFLARNDSTERDRVVIQQFSDYQNYKNLVSQVTKGDPSEKYILNYFSKLYAIKDKIFKSQEQSLGITEYDIDEYINSDSFNKILKTSEKISKKNSINKDLGNEPSL